MKRIVVLSDLQVPFHSKRAVAGVLDFVKKYKPDELWCVGDEVDAPQPARWNKNTATEYEGTLQRDLNLTHDLLRDFRKAIGDKPFYLQRSNHTSRLETYVRKYAPALTSIASLRIEQLLRLADINITYLRKLTELAPGWLMAHGDESTLGRYAGGTAINLAKKVGMNVVCGHSHRQGIVQESWGYNGRLQTITGFEVGHLMDIRKADYLRATGAANWQLGFGLLYVDGRNVTPVSVPIHRDYSFTVEGKRFGV